MTKSNLKIRLAEAKDAGDLHRLISELANFEKAPHEVTNTVDEIVQDGFGKNSIFTCYVAELNHQIVGMALVYDKYSTWKGRCLFLEDIIVQLEHRNKGIGKKLMLACIALAKEKQSKRMEWQVLNWNQDAIQFYLSLGAIVDGTWINCKFTHNQLQQFNFDLPKQ